MSPADSILEAQTAALLRRLAREQETRVRKLRTEAADQARDILRRTRSEARARVHQSIVDARREIENGIALRRAALDTQSRRARQAVLREILERAWERLPDALAARWQNALRASNGRGRRVRRPCVRCARRSRCASKWMPLRRRELAPAIEQELRRLGAGTVTVEAVPRLGAGPANPGRRRMPRRNLARPAGVAWPRRVRTARRIRAALGGRGSGACSMSLARITWVGGPVLRARVEGPFHVFEALAVGERRLLGRSHPIARRRDRGAGLRRHHGPRARHGRRGTRSSAVSHVGPGFAGRHLRRPVASPHGHGGFRDRARPGRAT